MRGEERNVQDEIAGDQSREPLNVGLPRKLPQERGPDAYHDDQRKLHVIQVGAKYGGIEPRRRRVNAAIGRDKGISRID